MHIVSNRCNVIFNYHYYNRKLCLYTLSFSYRSILYCIIFHHFTIPCTVFFSPSTYNHQCSFNYILDIGLPFMRFQGAILKCTSFIIIHIEVAFHYWSFPRREVKKCEHWLNQDLEASCKFETLGLSDIWPCVFLFRRATKFLRVPVFLGFFSKVPV